MKAIGCLFLILVCALGVAQTPPPPVTAIHWDCVSPAGVTLAIDLDNNPVPAIRLGISDRLTDLQLQSPDKTPPIITSVVYSNSVSVLANTSKILGTANGVPLTVVAADDVGVRNASLFVDGVLVTSTSSAPDILPLLFYLRWNARAVSSGTHTFRLIVYDAAGNSAEKLWTMTR